MEVAGEALLKADELVAKLERAGGGKAAELMKQRLEKVSSGFDNHSVPSDVSARRGST